MAYIAACTDKGTKRSTNQDACCVQVAQTAFGEVSMAIVCDGVGGLADGELASSTVAYRFTQWFREELPTLLASMDQTSPIDLDMIQTVWGVLLSNLNEMIHAYGRAHAAMLGTTFTGLLVCGNHYLIGHVGDCRVYQLGARGMRQVTEDQTLLAKKLASGEISPQEAKQYAQRHVILQSVGTEGILRQAFYRGLCNSSDLFVLCTDGGYRKAEDVGLDTFFAGVSRHDQAALGEACRAVLLYDLEHGEKDNLTMVCLCPEPPERMATETGRQSVRVYAAATDTGTLGRVSQTTAWDEGMADDEDLPTMVDPGEGDDEDLPTMVEPGGGDDEDLPTMVEPGGGDDEDLPTMVEPVEDDEDMPTLSEEADV